MNTNKVKKIAILTSRSGRNANDIIRAFENDKINARLTCIIGNKSHQAFIKKSEASIYDSYFLDHEHYSSRDAFDTNLIKILEHHDIDIVVSCSFSRLLSKKFIETFPNTINSHPSLLPAFPGRDENGLKPVDAAFEYGVKFLGVTVHFVDQHIDSGPIIIQAVTPAIDSLSKRDLLKKVLEKESMLKTQALNWLVNDQLAFNGREVIIKNRTLDSQPVYNDNWLVYPHLDKDFNS